MRKEELFSIIIVCENEEKYLQRCFESILSQTYQNIEVIFLDNCSDDDSFDVALSYVRKFQEKNMFLKVLNNKKKYSYWNNIKISKSNIEGSYLYYMTPYIVLDKNFVKTAVESFSEENVGAVVCSQVKKVSGEITDRNITHEVEFSYVEALIKNPDLWIGQTICKVTWFPMINRYMTAFNQYRNSYELFLFYCMTKVTVIEEVLVECDVEVDKLSKAEKNMMEIFELYALQLAFKEKVRILKCQVNPLVWEQAIENFVKKCVDKGIRASNFSEKVLAFKYFQMASVFDHSVVEKNFYKDAYKLIRDANERSKTT